MAIDFIPQSSENLSIWLDNISRKAPTVGPAVQLTPDEITALQGTLAAIQTPLSVFLAKEIELDSARGTLEQSLKANLPDIRRTIKRIKTARGYTIGIGEDLQIIGGEDDFQPETYRPTLTAESFPGYVRVKGKKSGVQSMNLYVRLKGQPEWRLLVARRSKFPFDDDSPLAMAGTPETREYRALGVINDEEIGQPSDIVSVVHGG